MKNFYIKVDPEYLERLTPTVKERLKLLFNRVPQTDGYSNFLRLCPYCNKFSLLSMPDDRIKKWGLPKVCTLCGETNPFDKIQLCSVNEHDTDRISLLILDLGIPVKDNKVDRVPDEPGISRSKRKLR
jgi:hypothetical protein